MPSRVASMMKAPSRRQSFFFWRKELANLEDLRSHVVGATDHLRHRFLLAILAWDKSREAKVYGAEVFGINRLPLLHPIFEQEVLRLQVCTSQGRDGNTSVAFSSPGQIQSARFCVAHHSCRASPFPLLGPSILPLEHIPLPRTPLPSIRSLHLFHLSLPI